MSARGNYFIVAALDFGTTYSGYAFSMGDSPETIVTNNNWGAALGFKSHKTPTSVLTDDKGNFLDMGFEAEQRYADSLVDKSETLHLYRYFKMLLHKSKNVKTTAFVTSLDDNLAPALEIFGYAMKYLREHLFGEVLKSTGRTPEPNEVYWVITVPAIWSEPSKKFMREAAIQGGCITDVNDTNLLLALEPEAASLCCRRLKYAGYAQMEAYTFPTGTTYLVLDCGGGTIDVTAHKILEGEKVEEILPASGGPWGGMYVDKRFEELLIQIFGTDFINSIKTKNAGAWLELLQLFETVKKSFTGIEGSKLRIRLPFCFAEGNNMEIIHTKLQSLDNKDLKINNGVLILGCSVATDLFAEITNEIENHTNSLLNDPKLNDAKFIFMVGGFSECALLQRAIKQMFEKGDLTVLIPNDCQLAVIKGAVLFGHYPLEITSRISRFTLGYELRADFDNKIHDPRRIFRTEEGKIMCDHVFDPIIVQGESVKVS